MLYILTQVSSPPLKQRMTDDPLTDWRKLPKDTTMTKRNISGGQLMQRLLLRTKIPATPDDINVASTQSCHLTAGRAKKTRSARCGDVVDWPTNIGYAKTRTSSG